MLDPADIEAIVRAIAAVTLPVAVATLLIGMTYSLLVGLKLVAPKAKKLILAELKDPESETSKQRQREQAAILKEFDAAVSSKLDEAAKKYDELLAALEPLLATEEVKDEKGQTVEVNALLIRVDQLIELANFVREAMIVDVEAEDGTKQKGLLAPNLPHLMDKAILKAQQRQQAAHARGDTTKDIEAAMQDAEWVSDNPEQAEALAAAHSGIEAMAPMFNWDEKKVARLHKQANDLARQGGNVKAFIDRLQGGRLLGGGVTAGGGQSGGGGRKIGT